MCAAVVKCQSVVNIPIFGYPFDAIVTHPPLRSVRACAAVITPASRCEEPTRVKTEREGDRQTGWVFSNSSQVKQACSRIECTSLVYCTGEGAVDAAGDYWRMH